jgi:hypothetical protein
MNQQQHLAENKISRCLKLKSGYLRDSTEPLVQISLDVLVYLEQENEKHPASSILPRWLIWQKSTKTCDKIWWIYL